jgi:acetyl-CoA carboxylase biotin carboxyl carrier protein
MPERQPSHHRSYPVDSRVGASRVQGIFDFAGIGGFFRQTSGVFNFQPTGGNTRKTVDFKDIKRIVELMDDHGLTQFKLEIEGSKLEMKKGSEVDVDAIQKLLSLAQPTYLHAAPQPVAAPAAPTGMVPAVAPVPEGGLAPGEVEIKSVLVGTFFRASSPDSEVFVNVGSEVTEDSVVCIVDAMKVMNQITAGVRGRITKVLAENGTPVQYGDPLFVVKLA